MKRPIFSLFYFLIFALLVAVFGSCRDVPLIKDPSAQLVIETDTVLFDTLFTTLGSATKRFMVYNEHDKAINISSIQLARGKDSPFRLNIDGEATTRMEDFMLLPQDSIYIFVDVTIDPNSANLPFIEKDSIVFVTNGNVQDVKLLAWGQNAHFLSDSMLVGNIIWTNDLPYVISNHVGIDENSKLSIQPGVQVFSDNGSAILVWGTLEVLGDTNNPVLFTGTRQEQYYENVPGQWWGIYFLRDSKDNYIKNASIRNSNVGIKVDSTPVNSNPNLVLENVRIENSITACLVGYSSHIDAYNSIFNNSCQVVALFDYGGKYNFYHCTFAHSGCNCYSHYPTVFSDNKNSGKENAPVLHDLSLNFYNCIIWGPKEEEIELQKTGGGNANVLISYSLLTTKQTGLNINNNILNKQPKFKNQCNYNYYIDSGSVVINAGDQNLLFLQPKLNYDLKGNPRNDGKPDLGALEYRK